MRKKLIGIFVIMLLITTALPVTGQLKEQDEKNIHEQIMSASVLYLLSFGFIKLKARINEVHKENNGLTFFHADIVRDVILMGLITIMYPRGVDFSFYEHPSQVILYVEGYTYKKVEVTDDYITLRCVVFNCTTLKM